MKTEIVTWSDQTGGMSKIGTLNLPGDRYWHSCKITVKATKGKPNFDLNFNIGSQRFSEGFQLENGKSKTFTYFVNRACNLSVTGHISRPAFSFSGAGARITLEGIYDESTLLEKESKSWHDQTGGNSIISNLFLNNHHLWEKCEIAIKGDVNKITGCSVTLLVDGQLKKPLPEWVVLNGGESRVFTFDIRKKTSLVVAGYISNNKLLFGGGARITLTGFYKKGK